MFEGLDGWGIYRYVLGSGWVIGVYRYVLGSGWVGGSIGMFEGLDGWGDL